MAHHYGNDNPRLAASRLAAPRDLHSRYSNRAKMGKQHKVAQGHGCLIVFVIVVLALGLLALPTVLAAL